MEELIPFYNNVSQPFYFRSLMSRNKHGRKIYVSWKNDAQVTASHISFCLFWSTERPYVSHAPYRIISRAARTSYILYIIINKTWPNCCWQKKDLYSKSRDVEVVKSNARNNLHTDIKFQTLNSSPIVCSNSYKKKVTEITEVYYYYCLTLSQ